MNITCKVIVKMGKSIRNYNQSRFKDILNCSRIPSNYYLIMSQYSAPTGECTATDDTHMANHTIHICVCYNVSYLTLSIVFATKTMAWIFLLYIYIYSNCTQLLIWMWTNVCVGGHMIQTIFIPTSDFVKLSRGWEQ